MKKIGILTFHYSQNYGALLQSYSLSKVLSSLGYDVEIINYVPEGYNPGILHTIGLSRNILRTKFTDLRLDSMLKRIILKAKYGKKSILKCDEFRQNYLNLSAEVNEQTIENILNEYHTIIVGSDQVWNPHERKKDQYFLNYNLKGNSKKISYAADSTISEIDFNKLSDLLKDFDFISVRNKHSFDFVKRLTGKKALIVADPTLLCDFNNLKAVSDDNEKIEYIFSYILGNEIKGTHIKVIEAIREKYGNLPVYFAVITTSNFNIFECADKVFYDLGPKDWLNLLKNAKFVYTDSFHGTLFALKYHKPFIAYYADKNRSTRILDIANRYQIDDFIVESLDDIKKKNCLNRTIDYNKVDSLIEHQRKVSLEFLKEAL